MMPELTRMVTMGAPCSFVLAKASGNVPWRAASYGVSDAMIT